MTPLESDPSLLDRARRLAARAGFGDCTVRPLDLGLSSDLFTVHRPVEPSPCAVVKLQRGFSAKVHAEAGALALLGKRAFEGVPRLLLKDASHKPPALVVSWLCARSEAQGVDLDQMAHEDLDGAMRAFGAWLATLHSVEVPPGEVKMSSDPLSLPERLLAQAEGAVERFARRFGGNETHLVALLKRASAHLQQEVGNLLTPDEPRRMIHRDLRPENVLVENVLGSPAEAEFEGVVDFEHAAAAHPAWDFVKLRWWWFDRHPGLEAPFREGYESKRAWPDAGVRRLFRIFEATTLVAYFFDRHLVYPGQASLQLRAELDGYERPFWGA